MQDNVLEMNNLHCSPGTSAEKVWKIHSRNLWRFSPGYSRSCCGWTCTQVIWRWAVLEEGKCSLWHLQRVPLWRVASKHKRRASENLWGLQTCWSTRGRVHMFWVRQASDLGLKHSQHWQSWHLNAGLGRHWNSGVNVLQGTAGLQGSIKGTITAG